MSRDLEDIVRASSAYLDVKTLSDGSIAALGDLMFTRAIFLGCDAFGWSRRYCFEDRERANHEYELLTSQEDVPTGWIARRPPQPEDYKDWP